jgi:hypothetical protein
VSDVDAADAGAKCLNCGSPLIGPFCAICGQQADAHRKPLVKLIGELADNFASWDSRTLRTIGALIFRPGELSLAFREGRRQRYVPALRLYIFATVFFFLVLSLADIALAQMVWRANDPGDQPVRILIGNNEINSEKAYLEWRFFSPRVTEGMSIPPDVNRQLDELRQRNEAVTAAGEQPDFLGRINNSIFEGITQLFENPSALSGRLADWLPRILFILLPLFALLLAIVYWRRRLYYVDHLVFALNLHTFLFVLLTVAVLLAQLGWGSFIAWTTVVIFAVYAYLSMKRFYGQGHLITGIKWASVSLIYSLFLLFPGMLAVLAFSLAGA